MSGLVNVLDDLSGHETQGKAWDIENGFPLETECTLQSGAVGVGIDLFGLAGNAIYVAQGFAK